LQQRSSLAGKAETPDVAIEESTQWNDFPHQAGS